MFFSRELLWFERRASVLKCLMITTIYGTYNWTNTTLVNAFCWQHLSWFTLPRRKLDWRLYFIISIFNYQYSHLFLLLMKYILTDRVQHNWNHSVTINFMTFYTLFFLNVWSIIDIITYINPILLGFIINLMSWCWSPSPVNRN